MEKRLSDVVVAIGEELVSDLYRESPLFRALHDGHVTKDAYATWLVQQHKYMRWTHDLLVDYARKMSARGSHKMRSIANGASRHAEEERGHDVNVLDDLAWLWDVSRDEAFRRVEASPTAPAVHLYEAVAKRIIAVCPGAFAGFAMAIEVLAGTLSTAAREALLANRPFEGVENAIRIFSDHEDDCVHVDGGRHRLDHLETVEERTAAVLAARLLKEVYRALFAQLDGETESRPRPQTVGASP